MKLRRYGTFRLLLIVGTSVLCWSSLAHSLTETHPFILYTAADYETIIERLEREPYATWYSRLISEANTILDNDVSWNQTTVAEVTKAYYAKLLAAAYAFSDSSAVNHDSYGTEAA